MTTPERFAVLFVSTGNVCRSPIAERLAEHELAAAVGTDAEAFRFSSAGTWGHDGAPMEPHARAVLAERGARASGFVARELLAEQIVLADLVLTASAEQSHQVRLIDPAAADRVFTLPEFARLAEEVELESGGRSPAARARALVGAVAALRRRRPSAAPPPDIADPYGAPLHVFRLCADEIADCLRTLVGRVAASHPASSGRAVS
jgi:protein-tyrosine phosphatase